MSFSLKDQRYTSSHSDGTLSVATAVRTLTRTSAPLLRSILVCVCALRSGAC
jgi:hypothetical protein